MNKRQSTAELGHTLSSARTLRPLRVSGLTRLRVHHRTVARTGLVTENISPQPRSREAPVWQVSARARATSVLTWCPPAWRLRARSAGSLSHPDNRAYRPGRRPPAREGRANEDR